MTIAVAGLVGMRLYGITDAVLAFFYPGTLGVLSLIVAYAVTNVGAARLFLSDRRERAWELVFPVSAIIVLAYVFDRNAVGQVYPFNWFPWVVVGVARGRVRDHHGRARAGPPDRRQPHRGGGDDGRGRVSPGAPVSRWPGA